MFWSNIWREHFNTTCTTYNQICWKYQSNQIKSMRWKIKSYLLQWRVSQPALRSSCRDLSLLFHTCQSSWCRAGGTLPWSCPSPPPHTSPPAVNQHQNQLSINNTSCNTAPEATYTAPFYRQYKISQLILDLTKTLKPLILSFENTHDRLLHMRPQGTPWVTSLAHKHLQLCPFRAKQVKHEQIWHTHTFHGKCLFVYVIHNIKLRTHRKRIFSECFVAIPCNMTCLTNVCIESLCFLW